jgi:hypothetical protein
MDDSGFRSPLDRYSNHCCNLFQVFLERTRGVNRVNPQNDIFILYLGLDKARVNHILAKVMSKLALKLHLVPFEHNCPVFSTFPVHLGCDWQHSSHFSQLVGLNCNLCLIPLELRDDLLLLFLELGPFANNSKRGVQLL